MKGPIVRDVESGVTAALRDSDIRHAGRTVGTLIAETAPDVDVTLPAGTLAAFREHVRRELLAELDEAGRLLPAGPLKVAPTRAA